MRSPIQWVVDWLYEQFERKDRARAWQRSTPPKQERVTPSVTRVDLYDTCPIQRVVNASVPLPPPPTPRSPGETTNVLRKYYAPRVDAPPGAYARAHHMLCVMGVLPRSGRR